MFPTRVGMNLGRRLGAAPLLDVPHTRGDEPLQLILALDIPLCSPHAWG